MQDGLKAGRIVYYVFTNEEAEAINRRRTDGASIAVRIAANLWPIGAQAHIGNRVRGGDVAPGMVTLAVDDNNRINVKVALDGTDSFWAQSVPYDDAKSVGTWHWMFDGQANRHEPKASQALGAKIENA